MSEQITTAEGLDALPVGSVILDLGPDRAEANAPVIACKAADGMWWVAGTPRDRRWRSFEVIRDAEGSVLVCTHRPDAPVTAGATVTRERDAVAAREADEAAGGYGYRASPAWRRSYLIALGLTVVDGPTEGGA